MSLNVYNQAAGRWFILHWWTDHERGHVSFAKTTEDLLAVTRDVFAEKPEAEVKGLYEIEMVGPSEKMERLAAIHDHKETVDRFYYEVAQRIDEVMNAGRDVPLPFEVCEKFEPEDEANSEDEWAKERHYGCKNCVTRLKLVGMTRDELYDRYAERWRTADKPRPSRRPTRSRTTSGPSAAPRATDDEKIWCALADFGDHAGGVELRDVDLSEAESFRPQCLSDRVLFFYRCLGELTGDVAIKIAGVVAEAKLRDLEEREEKGNKRKMGRKKELRDRIEAVLSFFKET